MLDTCDEFVIIHELVLSLIFYLSNPKSYLIPMCFCTLFFSYKKLPCVVKTLNTWYVSTKYCQLNTDFTKESIYCKREDARSGLIRSVTLLS